MTQKDNRPDCRVEATIQKNTVPATEADTARISAAVKSNGNPARRVSNCATSQQVSFSATCEAVEPFLDSVGSWPMIGTPEWLALPRGDRRWWAAVLDAGWHWALLLEGNQEASAQAGQAISTMADWAEVGQRMRDREEFIAKNPWAKRVAT